MENLEQFKLFVRKLPTLRNDVVNNKYTWQQLYEMYILYGKDHEIWDQYKLKTGNTSQVIAGLDLNTIISMVKNIDLVTLSNGLDGIQKALGVVSTMVSKDEPTKQQGNYQNERATFRRYDD
jgi:hypothetical protein